MAGLVGRGEGGWSSAGLSHPFGQQLAERMGHPRSSDTIDSMPPINASRRRQKSPPPGETGQEALYLRFLSDKQVRVAVKLRDGEVVSGWIEYFDDRMIRLTREGKPNLFIYKNQIRTITEMARRGDESRRRNQRKSGETQAAGSDRKNGVNGDTR